MGPRIARRNDDIEVTYREGCEVDIITRVISWTPDSTTIDDGGNTIEPPGGLAISRLDEKRQHVVNTQLRLGVPNLSLQAWRSGQDACRV